MRGRGWRGFTLIELLVAIAIISILATLLSVGLIPLKKKAYKARTVALIDRLRIALSTYFQEFKDYPPDGYDYEPGSRTSAGATGGWLCDQNPPSQGVYLGGKSIGATSGGAYYKGSACLVYFLCHPITKIYYVGADNGDSDARQLRNKTLPALLSDLPREAFSVAQWDSTFEIGIHPGTAAYKAGWEVCELLDSWGRPIHYDKVRDGGSGAYFTGKLFANGNHRASHPDQTFYPIVMASLSDSDEKLCPEQDPAHDGFAGTTTPDLNGDPRVAKETDGCFKNSSTFATAPRNRNSYDLWSHGPSWTNVREAITNWGR